LFEPIKISVKIVGGPALREACGVVALLTDFGSVDPYVAAMKGVILSTCPRVTVVDITHEVPSFDVEYGALTLLLAYRYFPPGTVFIGVVDPGVGSSRRPIAVVSRNYYFVGPDNGLLVPAAIDDGAEYAVVLDREEFYRKPTSASFHGRDIFAPIAARIACGEPVESLGSRVDPSTLVAPGISFGHRMVGGCVELTVVHVDRFGNVILSDRFENVRRVLNLSLRGRVEVRTKERSATATVEKVFSLAPPGALVLYENSFGYAELAVNRGSAGGFLQVSRGDKVLLCT
jgi:S-adenosylmethionine hydrolase